MPLDQLVPLLEDIAAVVHAAHEQGIIHRDLKPSNIMLIARDLKPSNIMLIARGGRWIPKLLDFGTAKMLSPAEVPLPEAATLAEGDEPQDEDEPGTDGRATVQKQSRLLTLPGFAMGSRGYMSPEQWHDAWSVGPETDIYSLGVVIYECLTGRRVFTAERTDDYRQQHLYAQVPPLGDRFPPALDRVLQRALAKRPGDRHRDVRELASDLRATLRASKREQLRSSALQWEDAGRA
jgi:serine/threonine protein kinase